MKRTRKIALCTAMIVVPLILGIIIGGTGKTTSTVYVEPSSPSAASTPSAEPSPPASATRAATIGSSFDVKDGSGDTYQVTLINVIDPAQGADQFTTPAAGTRFVAAVFSIKALTGSPQNEDANNDAVLLGGNDQGYDTTVDNNIVGYTNFSNGNIVIAQGQTEVGAVTFQVPDGVKVAEVQWVASSGFGQFVQWSVAG